MVFSEKQNAKRRINRRISVRRLHVYSLTSLALVSLSMVALTDQSKWSLYALGGFSVAFPSQPLAQPADKLPAGYRAWAGTDGANPYVFSLDQVKVEDAKNPPDALLAQCVSGLLTASKGSITAERDILLEGWPGVEIHYRQEPNVEGQIRAFVVKDRVVNLVVTHPLGSADPPGITRFFNSVKLPSDIEKGSAVVAGPVIEPYDLENSGFSAKVPKGVRAGEMKIGNAPAQVEMHRFATAYLNRVYMGVVIDPPTNASKDLDSDTTGKPAQSVNASIASLFGQVITKTGSKDAPLGKDWTAEFDLGHNLAGHLETYIRNNHTYSLLAIVPSSMLLSDEVKNFFASVTLPAKK